MQNRINFIHITDLHVDDPPRILQDGRDTTENHLQEVLSQIPYDKAEFMVCTGDLAADPSVAAYERLVSLLEAVPCPVYCLPGNHDNPLIAIEATQASNLAWNKTLVKPPWLLVMLDSHEPGAIQGRLGDTELTFLQQTLRQNPSLHTLLCLHHQPVPIGCEWLDEHTLKDQRQFFEIIDQHPQVRGIIWGHIHQTFEKQRNGVLLLGTPSTCTQFAPNSIRFAADTLPPAYRSISLHDDGEITTKVVWCGAH